jgi:hypothetical protein
VLQEVEAPRISRQSAHEGCNFVGLRHRPPLPQMRQLVLITVRGWVDPRPIVRPEGLGQWKFPMTPLEIETATFRLVAQCFNQVRHPAPQTDGCLYAEISGLWCLLQIERNVACEKSRYRGSTTSQGSRSHLQILVARRVIWKQAPCWVFIILEWPANVTLSWCFLLSACEKKQSFTQLQ